MKKQFLVLLAMCIALSFSACRAPTNNATSAQSPDANIESTPAFSANVASSGMDAGAITEAFGARRNLPQVLETERPPCLATFAPAAAATKAETVETLKV